MLMPFAEAGDAVVTNCAVEEPGIARGIVGEEDVQQFRKYFRTGLIGQNLRPNC